MVDGLRVGRADDPDHYELGQSVASGGEAVLYRGSVAGPGGQITVAIKVPLPEFEPYVDVLFERWKEQVELLRSLRHPGIVPVRETFLGPPPHVRGERPAGRQLYLVMDWVDGKPLDEWLLEHPDTNYLQRARQLAQIADVLDRVHALELTGAQAIVHRDVKPNNVIVGAAGPVLVDWGLVRGVVPDASRRPGEGTPAFMAPEVRLQGTYSPASDRFAFGCLVYYTLTGQYPPDGHSLETMRTTLLAVPGMERQYATVEHVLAMMKADPAERPTSCRNWLAGIARTTVVGIDSVPPAFPLTPDDAPRNRRRNLIAGALVLLTVAIVAGLLVARGPGRDAASGTPGSTLAPSTTPSTPPTTIAPATTIRSSTTVTSTGAATTTAVAPTSALPYRADWSGGRNGWFGPPDWKVLGGLLLDDGSGEYSLFKPIIAPLQLDSTPNYAAEAEIRVTRGNASSFGIVVRGDSKGGGYAAGIGAGWGATSGISDLEGWWGTADLSKRLVAGLVYDPGSEWHTYRVEAKANVITLFVDGAMLAQVTDNLYLGGGRVGLWCNQYQVEVRAFRVTAI